MSGALGKVYADGEYIMRQGEDGTCMFVIQEGEVEIVRQAGGKEVVLATRGAGEFVGEMAIFQKETRSADVRAKGNAKLLTVDRKNLLARIQDDPSVAFRLIETLAGRVRELTQEVAELRTSR